MKKTLAILVAAAFVVVASPSLADDEPRLELPAHLDQIVFQVGADHPGSQGRAYCTDDDAKEVLSIIPPRPNTYCTTGSHDPAVYSITHGPDLDMISSDFTGVVESIIQYDGGERRWTCSFSAGVWTGCQGSGSWPGSAVEFCHDTWAYESTGAASTPLATGFVTGCPNGEVELLGLSLGSNTQPQGDGLPSGSWGAYVEHG